MSLVDISPAVILTWSLASQTQLCPSFRVISGERWAPPGDDSSPLKIDARDGGEREGDE